MDDPKFAAVIQKYNPGEFTPLAVVLGGDGALIDFFPDYNPPPDSYRAKLENVLQGIDTFQSLSALYARDPKDVPTVYKLAEKFRFKGDGPAALKLYGEVLALDPEGTKGSADWGLESYPITELAALRIARLTMRTGSAVDPAPARAFLQKYPRSRLVINAYRYLESYYGSSGSKEEALAFYEEFAARFPRDPEVLSSFIGRILKDKDNLDKGIELSETLKEMNPDPFYVEDLAKLYLLKNDPAKAEEAFGKKYMDDLSAHCADGLMEYAVFWTQRKTNLESAEQAAEMAVRMYPESPYILRGAAMVYLSLSKSGKALAVFGPEFAARNRDDARNLRFYAQFWAGRETNLESALEAASRSVALLPASWTYDGLSQVHIKLKNYAEALEAAERAIELAPPGRVDLYKKKAENIRKLMEGKASKAG